MKLSLNKRGFTLIEVLLAVTLLVMVLSMGFNVYTFSNRAFHMAETYTNVQREMRRASEFISNELRVAYQVALGSSPSKSEYYEENYHAIFIRNGSIIHRYKNKDENKLVDKMVLDGSLDQLNYDLIFNKALDEAGNKRGNVVGFLLTADKVDYTIESSIIAHNLGIENEIEDPEGLSNAQHIYYTKLPNVEEETAEPTPGGRRCFIATAAYGSYQEPSVVFLRNFRDDYLLTNSLGSKFVALYYKYSPPIANIISNNEMLKGAVRIVLMPFVGLALITTVPGGFTLLGITLLKLAMARLLLGQLYQRRKYFN